MCSNNSCTEGVLKKSIQSIVIQFHQQNFGVLRTACLSRVCGPEDTTWGTMFECGD